MSETTCPFCKGARTIQGQECAGCYGTGKVELKVGDRVPMPPKPKLKVEPAKWVDSSARGPRGVFRNGRGKA